MNGERGESDVRPIMLKRLSRVFDWLDGIELAAYAIVASLLLVVGPVYLVVRFIVAHRYSPGIALALLWCGCVAICIRDVRQRRFSWVTGCLVALWLITMLWVGWWLEH